MFKVLSLGIVAALWMTPALVGHAQAADPLPPETRLVRSGSAPAPTEYNFTIAAAEDLVVTLTDLQTPAALTSATIVVTQTDAIVGDTTLAAPATSATIAVAGAVGQFTVRVFGSPGDTFSVGTFTVCVAPKTAPTNCIQDASTVGNISAPSSAADPTVSTQSIPLTVTTSGTYIFSFTDDQFPVALNPTTNGGAPNLALFQGSLPVMLSIPSGTAINLTAGTYTLLAIAQADPTMQAGLYGITITGPAGTAPLLSNTFSVGTGNSSAVGTNPSAQSLTLKVTDFAFPAALASAAAAVTSGGALLGTASASSSSAPTDVTAPSGALQLWTYATAGSGAGTYEVDLSSANGAVLQTAAGVNSGSTLAFAYVTPSSVAAGSYQALATDFQFPAALPSLQFAVAQNAVILQQAMIASALNFTTTSAGAVVLLAAATTPAGGNGLFDINLQTTASSPQVLFDQTQAVSLTGLFDSQQITLGNSGNYSVVLTDLMFPAAFQNLDLVVSSGGVVLGKILGGGSFPIAATPGTYTLSFIATPSTAQQVGLYGLQIGVVAPTVTLTASAASVVSGATATLTWSSANAVSCTGSGGAFAGSQPTSGTLAVAVGSATTFTLSCTGAGGTASQSVAVATTAAPAKSGGGGAISEWWLALLGVVVGFRIGRRALPTDPFVAAFRQ